MPSLVRPNKIILAAALAALLLVLSACGGSSQTAQPPATEALPPSPTFTQTVVQSAETQPGSATQVVASPTDTVVLEPTEITLGFDLGDPKLKATNPTAFVPASGEIQLVEFFAFW